MEEEHKSKCDYTAYTAAKEHFLCFFVVVINKFLQEDSLCSEQVQQDHVLQHLSEDPGVPQYTIVHNAV